MNGSLSIGQEFPNRIEIGGEMKEVTAHLKGKVRDSPELTPSRIKSVAENPLVSAISRDRENRDSRVYWGRVVYNQQDKLMRVAMSMDGARIVTAHLDDKATKSWRRGETTFFERPRFREIEVSDEFETTSLRCGN